jgi:glutathione S-transferase
MFFVLKLKYLDTQLLSGGKKYLVGNKFSIADSYLYIVLTWSPYAKVDLTLYKNVDNYFQGIKNLENIKNAHKRMETNPDTTI